MNTKEKIESLFNYSGVRVKQAKNYFEVLNLSASKHDYKSVINDIEKATNKKVVDFQSDMFSIKFELKESLNKKNNMKQNEIKLRTIIREELKKQLSEGKNFEHIINDTLYQKATKEKLNDKEAEELGKLLNWSLKNLWSSISSYGYSLNYSSDEAG